jgi:hypothetical protein
VLLAVEMTRAKKGPVTVGWPGLGSTRLAKRLVIPHIVNARAVASVQPCGWRGQQQTGQHSGAMIIEAYKLGPSLEQVNCAGGPLTHAKPRAEIPA